MMIQAISIALQTVILHVVHMAPHFKYVTAKPCVMVTAYDHIVAFAAGKAVYWGRSARKSLQFSALFELETQFPNYMRGKLGDMSEDKKKRKKKIRSWCYCLVYY